eukprot:3051963-Pyramimonas_sp.AAC.1
MLSMWTNRVRGGGICGRGTTGVTSARRSLPVVAAQEVAVGYYYVTLRLGFPDGRLLLCHAQGLPLVVVELAFGTAPFQLKPTEDAELLIQRRTDPQNVLWQKERMLNLALEKLTPNCTK